MAKPRIIHGIVDIDGTLTADSPGTVQIGGGHLYGNALFDVIRDAMVAEGWNADEAGPALVAFAERVVFWDYADLLEAFELPRQATWARLRAWHDRNLIVFEDGVNMIHALLRDGVSLSISSNNPLTGCLLKLQRAGLGGLDGAPLFRDIFCSNRVKGQKGAAHWWPRVLADSGTAPDTTVIIGDNPKEDARMPREAGYRHFCIVNREQPEPVRLEDGLTYVNSLERVPELLHNLDGN